MYFWIGGWIAKSRNSARVPRYPERYPPDNVEPIPMTYSIYCMGQDWLGKLASLAELPTLSTAKGK